MIVTARLGQAVAVVCLDIVIGNDEHGQAAVDVFQNTLQFLAHHATTGSIPITKHAAAVVVLPTYATVAEHHGAGQKRWAHGGGFDTAFTWKVCPRRRAHTLGATGVEGEYSDHNIEGVIGEATSYPVVGVGEVTVVPQPRILNATGGHHHHSGLFSVYFTGVHITPAHAGGLSLAIDFLAVNLGYIGIGHQSDGTAVVGPQIGGESHGYIAVVGGASSLVIARRLARLVATLQAVSAEGTAVGVGIFQRGGVGGQTGMPSRLQHGVLLRAETIGDNILLGLYRHTKIFAAVKKGALAGAHGGSLYRQGGLHPLVVRG